MSFLSRFLSGQPTIASIDNKYKWTSDPPDRRAVAIWGIAELNRIEKKGGLSAKDAAWLRNLRQVFQDYLQEHRQ